ncbi:MAG: ubiquinol-cytochrome C chaperone family protein [Rhodospirillaceae bacterium]|nr:ubiquinol-cytochrome C chaperone family protein [Rhodospirillaceae bacterium]
MLDFLVARRRSGAVKRNASALYAAAVAQARRPEFYTVIGVPDTLDGRFDMIVLHIHLLCRRLATHDAGPGGGELAQALFDAMFADMDRNLREMGVGDPSIPRRIKAMAKAFYGRGQAYEGALAGGDAALTAALARNIFNAESAPGAAALAGYVRRAIAAIGSATPAAFAAGQIAFPAVVAV